MKVFVLEFTKQTGKWVVRVEFENGDIQMEAFDFPTDADKFYQSKVKESLSL